MECAPVCFDETAMTQMSTPLVPYPIHVISFECFSYKRGMIDIQWTYAGKVYTSVL